MLTRTRVARKTIKALLERRELRCCRSPTPLCGRLGLKLRNVASILSRNRYPVEIFLHTAGHQSLTSAAAFATAESRADLLDLSTKWAATMATEWSSARSIKNLILDVQSVDIQAVTRDQLDQGLDDIVQCQLAGIMSAEALELQKCDDLQTLRTILKKLRPDCEARLESAGLLSCLLNKDTFEYLCDPVSIDEYLQLRATADALQKNSQKSEEEYEVQVREDEWLLQRLGLPPSDYLSDAELLVVPDAGDIIASLSEVTSNSSFVVPPPFEGATLEVAIRRHIHANSRALPEAVLRCLRLLGDAIVHVNELSYDKWYNVLPDSAKNAWRKYEVHGREVKPIVDAGLGNSSREEQLQDLLRQALTGREQSTIRGGALLGMTGLGKSELAKNVVVAKQLVGWALGEEGDKGWRHVGIYSPDPATDNVGKLRYAPPAAILAAGLEKIGLLREYDGSIPSWAETGEDAFQTTVVNRWLLSRRIDCTVVLDEIQNSYWGTMAKVSDHWVAPPDESLGVIQARARVFWRAVDDCIKLPWSAMLLLTGTPANIASIVYKKRMSYPPLHSGMFSPLWVENNRSVAEVIMMLLRQKIFSYDVHEWRPPPLQEADTFRTSVGKIHAQDAVLALALVIRDAKHNSWTTTGQVVHPSLQSIAKAVCEYEAGESSASFEYGPGRLTSTIAKDILSDDMVLRAARQSYSSVIQRAWESGMLARCIDDINSHEMTSSNPSWWISHIGMNTNSFRDVCIAVFSLLSVEHPDWAQFSLANPTEPLPTFSVKRVYDQYQQAQSQRSANCNEGSILSVSELRARLLDWRDQKMLNYRTKDEFPCGSLATATDKEQVGFIGGLYAFIVERAVVGKGIDLTSREIWSLQTQTGEDYELLVAESLHRGLVSQVLKKGALPSFPNQLLQGMKDPAVEYDRDSCLSGEDCLLLEEGHTSASTMKPELHYLTRRIFRESCAGMSGNLVLIIEEPLSPGAPAALVTSHTESSSRFHVVRVQVKSGDSAIQGSEVAEFFGRAEAERAYRLYEKLLSVPRDRIIQHRLLATPRPVPGSIKESLSTFQSQLSADTAATTHHADQQTTSVVCGNTEGGGVYSAEATSRLPTTRQDAVDMGEYKFDGGSIGLLEGKAFAEFMFPDARVAHARILASRSTDPVQRLALRDQAEQLESRLSEQLQPITRQVREKSVAQTYRWERSSSAYWMDFPSLNDKPIWYDRIRSLVVEMDKEREKSKDENE